MNILIKLMSIVSLVIAPHICEKEIDHGFIEDNTHIELSSSQEVKKNTINY